MGEPRLLDGIRVVDLGVGMAAALVAKFLADAGATVTRVPPPGGDPFASYFPAYEIWRRGAGIAEEAELEDLLAQADVCIVGGEDDPALERRRDGAQIAARHHKLVILDITAGPEGTAYAGRPATELLAQARSGLVWEQKPDRPIFNAFEPASYGAAFQGLIGLLAALYEREGSGRGQLVSTSLFEGALAWIGGYWAKLERPTPAADYVIPAGVQPLVFRTRDNKFIHIVIGSAGSKYGMYQALEIDDPSVQPGDSGMPQAGSDARNFFGDYDLLADHVAKRDRDELLAAIWARGLPAEPVLEPGLCWDDAQIARNGIIVTDSDGTRHVGLPFRYERVQDGPPKPPPAGLRRPLEGLRVVDCGAFVAGPLAGVFLAELGADVIKLEGSRAPDPNRSIFKSFIVANRGKRGLAVDLKDEEGRRIVQSLCAGADIVMNNFRPGVSARLGVDPASLHSLNPGLIILESPAYGSEGPLALKSGFDMVMQAWCGHEAKAGGRGGEPLWNRTNLVDMHGGMIGAVAVLSALVHRARTGDGAALEAPLVNAGIFGLSELVQRPDGRFEGSQRPMASLRGYHPAEALYEAKDGWVALVARGDDAIAGLRQGLGLAEALGRPAAEWDDPEEAAIVAAVADRTVEDLEALLLPLGVWLEPCPRDCESRILGDPLLLARGTVGAVHHPTFGRVVTVGTLYSFSRSEAGAERAPPLQGGSTREILREQGMTDDTIDALKERGVTAES